MPSRGGVSGYVVLFAALFALTATLAGQPPPLRVVSTTPTGEIRHLTDADEIRIVFSEPMVPAGVTAAAVEPSWIRITPAAPGSFYWSGTTTLVFSPDRSRPLPYATPFRVRIDGSATSVSGRSLGVPYEWTFSTPPIRLTNLESERKSDRFDSNTILALTFNQPVRAQDVAANVRVALTPYDWKAPEMSAAARAWLAKHDPVGLRNFDEKVKRVRAVTSSSSPVAVRVATNVDRRQFSVSRHAVFLETVTPPPPDAMLSVTIDERFPNPGPLRSQTHSLDVRMPPTFFIVSSQCRYGCDSRYGVSTSTAVVQSAFAPKLTVVDVSDPRRERPLRRAALPDDPFDNTTTSPTYESAGFPKQPPATTWRTRVAPEVTAADGQTLGYTWIGFATTANAPPLLAFEGDVWEARRGLDVPVNLRNVTSFTQRLKAISPSEIMPHRAARRKNENNLPVPDAGPVRRITPAPRNVLRQFAVRVGSPFRPRSTGLFWAALEPESSNEVWVSPRDTMSLRNRIVQVTNLGITLKDSRRSSLVFVSRLDTGSPVAGARVSVVDNANQTRWQGTTGEDGTATIPAMSIFGRRFPFQDFIVTAEKEGDVAYVGSDWHGDDYGAVDDAGTDQSPSLRTQVFADRGVYRPSERVHFKAILRHETPDGMRLLAAGEKVEMLLRDGRNSVVDQRTLEIGQWSSAEWSWTIPRDAALGEYFVQMVRAGEESPGWDGWRRTFLVAAYRRPDFRVEMKAADQAPIAGTPLHVAVEASYLFGAPLAARPVRWHAYYEAADTRPPAIASKFSSDRYAVGYDVDEDYSDKSITLSSPASTLDSTGHARISVPTNVTDAAYSYVVEAAVEDLSNQEIGRGVSVLVHPASVYVALARPAPFLEAGKAASTRVSVVDLEGERVENVDVTVSLFREQWVRAAGTGNWDRRRVAAGSWTLRSSSTEAPLTIAVPGSGHYVIQATARDAQGRQTRTEADFYALGSGPSWWRPDDRRLELTPERETWKPGESARILVHSPWPQATALVTTEREGVRTHRTVALRSAADTIEVPITEADIPNVYVSVVVIKGRTGDGLTNDAVDRPGSRAGHVRLRVDDGLKRLQVRVDADAAVYRPRQTMKVSAAVTTPAGEPVPSEVTLWAVDYGVLSLTDYRPPDLVTSIYAPKRLGVLTSDTRWRLIGRTPTEPPRWVMERSSVLSEAVNVTSESVGQAAVEGDIRTDFRPLALWVGSAVAGADGRVETTVTLPDSLTTYRVIAVAGDERSRFGSGTLDVRVARPLTLMPSLPRFMTKGDRASFGATATNTTAAAGDAVVTIETLTPDALRIEGATSRTVRLEPGASVPARFDAVAHGGGTARVRMTIRMGSDTDAFELPFPINTPVRVNTTAAYGTAAPGATEHLSLAPPPLPERGGLTVELASTALVGLGETARYLDEYPYKCAEQSASRALALILTSELKGAFNLADAGTRDHRAEAQALVTSLAEFQCNTGGFSLWPGQCFGESLYLTAFIMHTMNAGASRGLQISEPVRNRALDFLSGRAAATLPAGRWWPVNALSQAYALKVLAESGRPQLKPAAALAARPDPLPVAALSHLADVYAAANDRGPVYVDIIRRLSNALRVQADRAHVEETADGVLSWVWNNNVTSTAIVLDGFARRGDRPEMIAPMARWLLDRRRDSRWSTTHENARALEALANYYRAAEWSASPVNAAVAVGSTTIGQRRFEPRSTTAQRVVVSMSELLKITGAAPTPLTISRDGNGPLFYTARLETVTADTPHASDQGIRVDRRYTIFRNGAWQPASTFETGDIIRVSVTMHIRGEGRYIALTDPLPAGVEPIDHRLATTPPDHDRMDLLEPKSASELIFRRGWFDHIERHEDRVLAFATHLGAGAHELTYLVRATTAGTFLAPGARAEAMYAPELNGRSPAATVTIK